MGFIRPFEKEAMNEEPLPIGLDIADQFLFLGLKYLYAMHRRGLISRDRASKEKEKLVFQWKTEKSKLEFLSREAVELSERIKRASDEFKESRTLENADALYAALYNLPNDWRDSLE